MSSIRPTGPGPSMLRINGQEITTRPSAPVEAPKPAGGAPVTDKPVTPTGDTSALQEEMYDAAHMASLRGEAAAAAIQGKKKAKKRDVKKKDKGALDELLGDNARVEGIFPEGDPSNRQEKAFQTAAEFEEEVKSKDLTFKRKAGQVEVAAEIFRADIDDGNGALVMGESTAEIDLAGFSSVEDVDPDREETAVGGRPKPPSHVSVQQVDETEILSDPDVEEAPRDETVPNVPMAVSETGLRRALGLGKK